METLYVLVAWLVSLAIWFCFFGVILWSVRNMRNGLESERLASCDYDLGSARGVSLIFLVLVTVAFIVTMIGSQIEYDVVMLPLLWGMFVFGAYLAVKGLRPAIVAEREQKAERNVLGQAD